MPGDVPDTRDGQPPTSLPETVQSQTSGTDTHAPHPPAHGHHPHIEFRFLDELKHRNIIRVGILYLVVCWLILDPVHVVFHMLEVPAWANRLVVILMAVGFPAVLLFAWVYEITPEGLKPTVEVAPTRSIRKQTAQRLNRAIVVVLSTHVTTEQHKPGATAVVTDRSIAVLPFADMSEKKDQEYFADGMAEEVIDLLAKLPGLRVIGRTSSFQIKGKGADLRAIGSTLGVAYVVEGSVRKSGERLRVTVQLISTHDGSHLWSEVYDAATGDVLQVQDQIATGLVRALQVTVGADDLGAPPLLKSSEAYDLYLRGRHAVDQWDRAGFEAAAGYFQQALVSCPADS